MWAGYLWTSRLRAGRTLGRYLPRALFAAAVALAASSARAQMRKRLIEKMESEAAGKLEKAAKRDLDELKQELERAWFGAGSR